jgi:acyl-CoA thioester hydrolase
MEQLTSRSVVYPWHCDHMGHMNVMWYTGKFDEASWHFFGSLGLGARWLRARARGMAAVEQSTEYRRELQAGDLVSIYTRLLEIKPKTLRFIHEMRRQDSGETAATSVLVAVHLDTELRKACPFPAELVETWRTTLLERRPGTTRSLEAACTTPT